MDFWRSVQTDGNALNRTTPHMQT